jgi:hypothetical protein
MATTQAGWITSIVETLTVTGINRKYTHPPAALNTADLPASFPWGFRRRQEPMTFEAHGGFPFLTLDFVIACEAVGQSTQPANYELIQTLTDALDTALAGVAPKAIGKGPVLWEIRGGDVRIEVAGNEYWGIIATIEGRG